jgi:predicted transcriptional regulator
MSELIYNSENLQLLDELVSGNVVSVNLSELSGFLGKHRNTIKNRVENIFRYNLLDPPAFPFLGMYKVYPLLSIINIYIPECAEFVDKFRKWVKEDPQIFAAFSLRYDEYNTLLFTFHEDITSYQLWMISLPSILKVNYGIPDEYANLSSCTSYFSNQLMIKYNPSTGINLMEADFREKGELTIHGCSLDELDLKILRCLLSGKGIKVNKSLLCSKTNLHRKTIERRISSFIKAGVISEPVCRFPNFFVPPSYILTYMLVDLKKMNEKVIREIIMDSCIPVAIRTIHNKYNLLVFGNHRSIEDQIKWEEEYRKKFPDSFGGAIVTYLSPEATISFSQQIVSLSYFRKKIKRGDVDDLRKTLEMMGLARSRILYDLMKR